MSSNKKSRKSYSVKRKLDILKEYHLNVTGSGLAAISKKHDISISTLRGWVEQKSELEELLKDQNTQSGKQRRLSGGGQKPKYPELEQRLVNWIQGKNEKGLRVIDKYISLKAVNLFNSLKDEGEIENEEEFNASDGWVAGFKKRHNLVSRRQASSRTLPEGASDICRRFIQDVQNLIDQYRIKKENIINMDQVPRYFESEQKHTITKKGSKEVLMRKGGSNHKRFTVTFAITGDGTILKPHFLFAKLQNKPQVPEGVIVDVNKTGMWNAEILKGFVKSNLLSRRQTLFSREPVLLIIDSYDCHIKLANSKELEKSRIYIVIVPPNLTNILQPLDVAVNRSFQAYYSSKYDEYIAKALDDTALQTKQGNPKVPKYSTVCQWVLDWMESKNAAQIQNAFPRSEFNVEALHPPLKDLLKSDFDVDNWNQLYSSAYLLSPSTGKELFEDVYEHPIWFFPTDEKDSFYKCICKKKQIIDEITAYKLELIAFMRQLEEIRDLTDDEYFDQLRKEGSTVASAELFAVSKKENWSINVKDPQTGIVETYKNTILAAEGVIDLSTENVELVRLEKYFIIKMLNSE